MNALPLLLVAVMAAESGPSPSAANSAEAPAPETGTPPARPDAAARETAARVEPVARIEPASTGAADVTALLAAADAAWAARDQPGKLDELFTALEAAAARAPNAYEVLWRQARHLTWVAEDPKLADGEKSRIGKKAWELGDAAAALEPKRVEGHFFAMSGVGNYSLGIGVLSALTKGIERKFKDRLSRAEAIDPNFEGGLIQLSWGRFYYELPWPKHDARLSEKFLRDAVARNGENVRALVYLGDLLLDEGRRDDARATYQQAVAIVPGKWDPPEQRRWQQVAHEALEKLSKKK
jgi:tetratricopeptide (TPR) repeat protein